MNHDIVQKQSEKELFLHNFFVRFLPLNNKFFS